MRISTFFPKNRAGNSGVVRAKLRHLREWMRALAPFVVVWPPKNYQNRPGRCRLCRIGAGALPDYVVPRRRVGPTRVTPSVLMRVGVNGERPEQHTRMGPFPRCVNPTDPSLSYPTATRMHSSSEASDLLTHGCCQGLVCAFDFGDLVNGPPGLDNRGRAVPFGSRRLRIRLLPRRDSRFGPRTTRRKWISAQGTKVGSRHAPPRFARRPRS